MPVDINHEANQLEENQNSAKDLLLKLDQTINKIIQKEGFIKCKTDKKLLTTNGDNYMGTLYEIDIKGQTKYGDKELNIFVKNVTPNIKDLLVIDVLNAYKTELFVYKELSKLINELQDEANVPLNERYKIVKCYDETDTKMIVMDNLSRKGYITGTGNKTDLVSLNFAEMALLELAKLHALSYVIKVKHPEYFETRIKTLKPQYILGEGWQGFVQSMCIVAIDNIDEEYKERIKNFSLGIADRFGGNFHDETMKRCLCHGDFKPNNILVKMKDGEILEMIPVDYQMLHYGCPIYDIFYFIFFCTDRKFRKAHLPHLKDFYHENLTNFLKYFDIDVNKVYSRKEFEKDYNDKLDHGLMLSLILLPFGFAAEDDVPDTTKIDVSEISFRLNDEYKRRIRDIIEDYIEWGVI